MSAVDSNLRSGASRRRFAGRLLHMPLPPAAQRGSKFAAQQRSFNPALSSRSGYVSLHLFSYLASLFFEQCRSREPFCLPPAPSGLPRPWVAAFLASMSVGSNAATYGRAQQVAASAENAARPGHPTKADHSPAGAFTTRCVTAAVRTRCKVYATSRPKHQTPLHAATSAAARPGRPPSRRVHCSSGRLMPFCPGSCCPSFS